MTWLAELLTAILRGVVEPLLAKYGYIHQGKLEQQIADFKESQRILEEIQHALAAVPHPNILDLMHPRDGEHKA